MAKLRADIASHLPEIVERLVEAAKAGDVGATWLLQERIIPPMKATEAAAPLTLSGATLTDQSRAVLAAIASGELAPGQGAALPGAVGTMARVVEPDELERRVAVLEGRHGRT